MANIKIEDFSKEMDKLVREFYKENFEATQEALVQTAQKGAQILENQSPVKTGTFKASWGVEAKYANAKFIHNTALAANRIPLTNIIEYARNQRPFILETFNRYQADLMDEFIKNYTRLLK